MEVTIEYNPGDTVYFMKTNKVVAGTIKGFKISSKYSGYSYREWESKSFPIRKEFLLEENPEMWKMESEIFKTREDLIKSL